MHFTILNIKTLFKSKVCLSALTFQLASNNIQQPSYAALFKHAFEKMKLQKIIYSFERNNIRWIIKNQKHKKSICIKFSFFWFWTNLYLSYLALVRLYLFFNLEIKKEKKNLAVKIFKLRHDIKCKHYYKISPMGPWIWVPLFKNLIVIVTIVKGGNFEVK